MSITCDCSRDDGELPEFSVEEFHIARKEHKCCECGEIIKPGQKYQKISGLWDGHFSRFKTCMPCYNIRENYCSNGYIFGGLAEEIRECFGFDYRNL